MALKTMTDRRYYGKVCERHPEFEGLRLKRANKCVQCQTEDRMCVSRGTLSVAKTLDSEIHLLQKEWDKHNVAMREIRKQLETLMLERDEKDQEAR